MMLSKLNIKLFCITLSVVSVSATWYRCSTPCSGVDPYGLTKNICDNLGLQMEYCFWQATYFCDVGDINSGNAYAFEGQCNTCNRNGIHCSDNCDHAIVCGG